MMHGKLLTQDEVDGLPEGTPVLITWSGGNGPHRYTIKRFYNYAIAKEADSLIDFIGPHPLTMVSLIEEPGV